VRQRLQAIFDRPLLLAVAYLCLVPGFATVYAEVLPPGSFYDSNLSREPSHATDRVKLSQTLADAIRAQTMQPFTERVRSSRTTFSLRLDPASILVQDLRLAGRGVTFSLSCRFLATADHKPAWAGYWQAVKVRFPPLGAYENPPQLMVSPTVGPRPNIWRFEHSPLFHLFPHFADMPPGNGVLSVSNATYATLMRFSHADRGDASSASDRWLRMLYFSVVTVTTLGFGDIAPVTTVARTWVTAEALLGVVLIGLFLNALALRAGAGRYAPPSDRA
jgi:hypothetical protein